MDCVPTFRYKFLVHANLETVRAFHQDTNALKKLTPPLTILQLHSVEPLAEGSVSKFTLWLGPIPIPWMAVHRDVTEHGFTDFQAAGPAQSWEHTHRFTAIDETTTEVSEHIEFEHKPGIRGLISRLLFCYPNLMFLFTYRRWATRRALQAKTRQP